MHTVKPAAPVNQIPSYSNLSQRVSCTYKLPVSLQSLMTERKHNTTSKANSNDAKSATGSGTRRFKQWFKWMCCRSAPQWLSRALTSLTSSHNSPVWPLTPAAVGCKKKSFLIWQMFPSREERKERKQCVSSVLWKVMARINSNSLVCIKHKGVNES